MLHRWSRFHFLRSHIFLLHRLQALIEIYSLGSRFVHIAWAYRGSGSKLKINFWTEMERERKSLHHIHQTVSTSHTNKKRQYDVDIDCVESLFMWRRYERRQILLVFNHNRVKISELTTCLFVVNLVLFSSRRRVDQFIRDIHVLRCDICHERKM